MLEQQSRFWKCPENTPETTLKLLIYVRNDIILFNVSGICASIGLCWSAWIGVCWSRCFSLSDKYIEYEYKQYECGYLAMIHTGMMENLIQESDHYVIGVNFSYPVLVYIAGFFL